MRITAAQKSSLGPPWISIAILILMAVHNRTLLNVVDLVVKYRSFGDYSTATSPFLCYLHQCRACQRIADGQLLARMASFTDTQVSRSVSVQSLRRTKALCYVVYSFCRYRNTSGTPQKTTALTYLSLS